MTESIFHSSFDYQTKTLNVSWTIKHLQCLPDEEELCSKTFASRLYPDYKWKLIFSQIGLSATFHISKQSDLNKIKIYYVTTVSDSNNNNIIDNEIGKKDFSNPNWQIKSCIWCQDILVRNITCNVSIKYLNGYVGFDRISSIDLEEIGFHHLLGNDLYSDFELVVGDKKLRVHKKIIASRCDYLHKLVESNIKEPLNNQFIIDDFEYETIWQFVRFIYTGIVAVYQVPLALDLYKLARIYNEQQLKDDCLNFIADWTQLPELISVLIAGHYYDEPKLFEAAMKLFKNHKGKTLKDFEQFDLIADYSQSTDLLFKVIENLNAIV